MFWSLASFSGLINNPADQVFVWIVFLLVGYTHKILLELKGCLYVPSSRLQRLHLQKAAQAGALWHNFTCFDDYLVIFFGDLTFTCNNM